MRTSLSSLHIEGIEFFGDQVQAWCFTILSHFFHHPSPSLPLSSSISSTQHSTPIHSHCTDRVELSLQMPTEGKPRLLPTEQMAESGLHGLNRFQSKAKESALLFVPRAAIVCYSHLGRADVHRGQREAGTACVGSGGQSSLDTCRTAGPGCWGNGFRRANLTRF